MPVLDTVLHLALALWVGGAFAFGALFAPALFRTLPSRQTAGTIAGAALARLEALGLVVSGVVLLGTLLQLTDTGLTGLAAGRVAVAVAMLGLLVYSSTSMRGRLAAVRAQIGPRPIDDIPEDNPLRQAHRRLHRRSTLVFSLAMLLGAVEVALISWGPGAV